ncbi:pre-mRNA-splicing factor 38B isoform X2 [Cherax quadricarinatus]|uniref:pre-mRNA-splicing factor 38B isoform X2 n=1 Tax=Cherax quadricarinatus TaxID=27406 RepID=UPI00387EA80B
MKAGAYEYEEDGEKTQGVPKKANGLPIWGNEKTMNLNPLILTNIQSSQYFKVNLYQLKTYHEVIDEIYYNVTHLEPWEKGSRKTSGQTGMCGGVRGVGAGGIVSTAFCILYKLYTLRLTRKQVTGLLNHGDSPYIRGLGFMYISGTTSTHFTEIDVRAGGGQTTTVGQIVRHMLSKLDWYSTLFPRIPVPIQKDLEKKLAERASCKPVVTAVSVNSASNKNDWYGTRGEADSCARESTRTYESGNKDYSSRDRGGERERDRGREYDRDRGKDRIFDRNYEKEKDREYDKRNERPYERSREQPREKNGDYERSRDRHRERERDYDKERDHDRERDYDRHRHRDKERKRSRSRSRDKKHRHRSDRYVDDRNPRDFADLLEREKYRIKKEKKKEGSREHHHRSRSRERERRHRY